MRIVVGGHAPVRLEAPGDFRKFSIAIDASWRGLEGEALSGIAERVDGAHAWIRPETVRALSPFAGAPDWETGFRGMIDYARDKGWSDPDGGIRAHIELLERPTAINDGAFRAAMRDFASGVCIVACGEGDARRGMTVSAFSSVSAEPPLVLTCLNSGAGSHDAIVSSATYSVNILSGVHGDEARIFAGQTSLCGAARFSHDRWSRHASGTPLFNHALHAVVCAPEACHRAGTHTVLIGRVIDCRASAKDSALVSFRGDLVELTSAAKQRGGYGAGDVIS